MRSIIFLLPLLGIVWSYQYHDELPDARLVEELEDLDLEHFPRQRRSPEPFVDRSNTGDRRGGAGPWLPPGVNPTFPKNGGQWPKTYQEHRYRRSAMMQFRQRNDVLFPPPSPTFPNPPRNPPRHARSPMPEPFVDRSPSGGRGRGGAGSWLPPGVNPTFPKNGGQWPEAYQGQRFRRSAQKQRPRFPEMWPTPSPTYPNPPTRDELTGEIRNDLFA